MDSYSGRFPLDFISFCLDSKSEHPVGTQETQTTSPAVTAQSLMDQSPSEQRQLAEGDSAGLHLDVRPPSNFSSSSGNTEESMTTFASQTLRTMASLDPSLDITFLATVHDGSPQKCSGPSMDKASESEAVIAKQPKTRRADAEGEGSSRLFDSNAFDLPEEPQRNYFETSASEIEDILDSAGEDGLTDRPTSSIVGPELLADPSEAQKITSESLSRPLTTTGHKEPTLPTELSANGRLMLRKYFTQNTPIELPRGHTTVAFSEPQIHAVLKTISDETVKSSLHSMRSLVLQAIHGGKGQSASQLRKALIRGSIPDTSTADSSRGESDGEGYTTDGNTSGAYSTDEEIGGTVTSLETDSGPNTPIAGMHPSTSTAEREVTLGKSVIPSPGYSEGDYEPLSTLGPQVSHQPGNRSPPRKRRKLMSRPGKVMKPAYFKGIQWTKVFVTGTLDPVHNKYKFYCQICKTNVSIFSKGAREIVRHYQNESHLRKDQRWRYEHLGKLDKITGTTVHAVRGKDGHVLTAFELQKEKPLFETAPLVDIGPRYPFYDEYMASAGGLASPDDVRLGTQISLIGRLVPYSGDITLLQGLWSEVGNFTNHQELFGDLDWSSITLTVRVLFVLIFCIG